jgi:hypothetical protein
MQKFIQDRLLIRTSRKFRSARICAGYLRELGVLLFAGILTGCGGGGSTSSNIAQTITPLSGNWQFTVANPADLSFTGGLQGGFLLQKDGVLTGSAVYSVSSAAGICSSGSAPINGTIAGQNITLTAVAGNQSFTFTGMLNTTRNTIVGTYGSTAGTAADGSACGTVQTGLQWSASLVPQLTGTLQGSFHSTSGPLSNQDFPVSLTLTQGENIGASNAGLSGLLSFVDPTTLLSDYPCFDTASVTGQISGNTVTLQIIGLNGASVGQIGGPPLGTGLNPVTYDSTQFGYIMHSAAGTGYIVQSKTCPGGGSLASPGDSGNLCLAMSTAPKACQQPIALSPAFLTFPPQMIGATPTSQTITLANNSPQGSTVNGLQLQFDPGSGFFGSSDFDGLPNFTELDNCAPTLGDTFLLLPGQFCSITITFTPQESCPWLPQSSQSGTPPAWCPVPLVASLTVNSPSSADNDTSFKVPITGTGLSAVTPSAAELDFSAEALGESSLPQLLSFTNRSPNPVQILGSMPCLNNPPVGGTNVLPRPLITSSPVAGLQVVNNISPDNTTVSYSCDSDPTSLKSNFQISSDTCTGTLLASQGTCSLQVTFVPQPDTPLAAGLDYFLELNTIQCVAGSQTADCEVDAGRFPVELKASPPTPLRLSPAAGIDFGAQAVGHGSGPQKITLLNDPADPNATTITLVGKIVASGDYSESDDCPLSLAPGAICTLTVTFKPKVLGSDPGMLTINYTPEVSLSPQFVYLHGAGQ